MLWQRKTGTTPLFRRPRLRARRRPAAAAAVVLAAARFRPLQAEVRILPPLHLTTAVENLVENNVAAVLQVIPLIRVHHGVDLTTREDDLGAGLGLHEGAGMKNDLRSPEVCLPALMMENTIDLLLEAIKVVARIPVGLETKNAEKRIREEKPGKVSPRHRRRSARKRSSSPTRRQRN